LRSQSSPSSHVCGVVPSQPESSRPRIPPPPPGIFRCHSSLPISSTHAPRKHYPPKSRITRPNQELPASSKNCSHHALPNASISMKMSGDSRKCRICPKFSDAEFSDTEFSDTQFIDTIQRHARPRRTAPNPLPLGPRTRRPFRPQRGGGCSRLPPRWARPHTPDLTLRRTNCSPLRSGYTC
jgi:hypothetical protein